MKLTPAVIILFCSIATNFAGNEIAQNSCAVNCQIQFDICARLRGTGTPSSTIGTQQVAPPTSGAGFGPVCESDRDFCLRACALNPRG
jgi:hypothetical protein